jgi:oligoribonuclease
MKEVEDQMLALVQKHCKAGRSPLCGNSIHQDRRFLELQMPRFLNYLHYRIVDVSTIKEVSQRWFPQELAGVPPKAGSHLALTDVLESIEELK